MKRFLQGTCWVVSLFSSGAAFDLHLGLCAVALAPPWGQSSGKYRPVRRLGVPRFNGFLILKITHTFQEASNSRAS